MNRVAALRMFDLACGYDSRLRPRDPDALRIRKDLWAADLADIDCEGLVEECIGDWFGRRPNEWATFNSARLRSMALEKMGWEAARQRANNPSPRSQATPNPNVRRFARMAKAQISRGSTSGDAARRVES